VNARPVADLSLCSVVKAELIRGVLRSSRPATERAKVDAFVKQFVSLPFGDDAAEVFARIRYHLESRGIVIGPYDMQIASIALANQLTVVTHNVAEFSRVPGLTVEDWEMP
jgi:tRNA(fMet)-specific endonuclease VapC